MNNFYFHPSPQVTRSSKLWNIKDKKRRLLLVLNFNTDLKKVAEQPLKCYFCWDLDNLDRQRDYRTFGYDLLRDLNANKL
jgi:hypothetical protein